MSFSGANIPAIFKDCLKLFRKYELIPLTERGKITKMIVSGILRA